MHPEVWYDAIILIRKTITRAEGNIIIKAPEGLGMCFYRKHK